MSATARPIVFIEEALDSPLQPEERERVLHALDALLEGDEKEQRETFAFLKKALDQRAVGVTFSKSTLSVPGLSG